MFRMIKRAALFAVILSGSATTGCARAAEPESAAEASTTPTDASDPTYRRSEVQDIIREYRKIVSLNGVEELLEAPINGTKQWVSVRGRDRRNPILLVIHGGPAAPDMQASWAFQHPWEDYFTVVQWDQRGAGKTYNANDPEKIRPTIQLSQYVSDAVELSKWLATRYGKEKIFVMGHSWGSMIGLSIAYQHPELLHAYIGIGQFISGVENERQSYAHALDAAKKSGNQIAIQELKAIAPYPEPNGDIPLAKINVERKWSVHYGGLAHGRSGFGWFSALGKLSPEYNVADIEAIDKGSQLSLEPLLREFPKFDFTGTTRFRIPIVMFEGRHDYTTPSKIVDDWFKKVTAPSKKLVWFENSAHMIMTEEPGRVLVHLVQDVRPLAREADDAP